MTCIVGLVDKDGIYIGGDSAAVGEEDLSYNIRTDVKVFKRDDFIIGFSTSFRMGQILRYKFRIPNHPKAMDNFQYMTTLFVDAVKKCFIDNDYTKFDEDGAYFMVGYRGKIYSVLSEFQIAENKENFAAMGCGEQFALGALYACQETSPKKKLEVALNAAAAFSMGVKPPFVFEQILNKKRPAKKK
jgi:ATP-dependent protease HslVU (ClpYQ) peptidase subunit